MNIRLVVYKRKSIYDDLIISENNVYNYQKLIKNNDIEETNKNNNEEEEEEEDKKEKNGNKYGHERELNKLITIFMNKRGFNAYFASAYTTLLKNSNVYRRGVLKVLKYLVLKEVRFKSLSDCIGKKIMDNYVILMRLVWPKKQFLDYKWDRIITTLALERKEINYAMSWLSTLGGAFSAMGDQFDNCAEVAGKISVQQFKLALRLNDPLLVARCKLYACLSQIQRKKFNLSRREIPKIYLFAKINKDTQLQKMCQGVWSKFKYCYYLHKELRKKSN